MKKRTNYKRPLFFGWYAIPSANKKNDDWKLPLRTFSSSDLEYLYEG